MTVTPASGRQPTNGSAERLRRWSVSPAEESEPHCQAVRDLVRGKHPAIGDRLGASSGSLSGDHRWTSHLRETDSRNIQVVVGCHPDPVALGAVC